MKIEIAAGRGPQPYFFRMIASNGKELAKSSEMYLRKDDAMHAARLIMSEAGSATIIDTTVTASSRW